MTYRNKPDESSESESIEGDVNEFVKEAAADWGKAKYDYYYTDYVDKDYPSSLNAKEERLARLEQEEALRIQKKLLSTLDNVNYDFAIDKEAEFEHDFSEGNLIDFIEAQNKNILASKRSKGSANDKAISGKKRVKFSPKSEAYGSDECEFDSDTDDHESDGNLQDEQDEEQEPGRKRRPINMAIKKNRGLTPYKKREHRNPRIKHKLKYKKALSKRRHLVKEAQAEYHRYSGEKTGIKTSTIRSIRLC